MLFSAIGYALFNRERKGEGQWMDISMIDSLFHMHELNLQVNQLTDGAYRPAPSGNHHPLVCPCGVYKSPQGYISLLIVQPQWPNMCAAMERPDLLSDARFAQAADRASNQAELIPIIEQWMSGFEDDMSILTLLEEHRVPSGPVLNPADAVNHPFFLERGTVRPVNDPILGELMLPGFPLRFSGQSDYSAKQAPMLGQHNAEVLSDVLNYEDHRIADLAGSGLMHSSDK